MAPCQHQKDSALNTEIESLKVNTNALINSDSITILDLLGLEKARARAGQNVDEAFSFRSKNKGQNLKMLPLRLDDLDVEDSAPCRPFLVQGASGITEQPIR